MQPSANFLSRHERWTEADATRARSLREHQAAAAAAYARGTRSGWRLCGVSCGNSMTRWRSGRPTGRTQADRHDRAFTISGMTGRLILTSGVATHGIDVVDQRTGHGPVEVAGPVQVPLAVLV